MPTFSDDPPLNVWIRHVLAYGHFGSGQDGRCFASGAVIKGAHCRDQGRSDRKISRQKDASRKFDFHHSIQPFGSGLKPKNGSRRPIQRDARLPVRAEPVEARQALALRHVQSTGGIVQGSISYRNRPRRAASRRGVPGIGHPEEAVACRRNGRLSGLNPAPDTVRILEDVGKSRFGKLSTRFGANTDRATVVENHQDVLSRKARGDVFILPTGDEHHRARNSRLGQGRRRAAVDEGERRPGRQERDECGRGHGWRTGDIRRIEVCSTCRRYDTAGSTASRVTSRSRTDNEKNDI